MRKICTFVIAGTACGLAGAQDLDIERAYAAELSADAANRSSLLQGAGEGSGFQLTSGDGASTLNINALFQFRYVSNWRDDDVVGSNDYSQGFEIPRARIDLSGNVMNENLTYRISMDGGLVNSGETGASDNHDFVVTWAYAQYAFEGWEGAFLRAGQFKAPLLWEELVDAEFQLAADRSVANEAFSQQYTQGLMFGYEAEAFRGYFSLTEGLRAAGVGYAQGLAADVALTARGEFKFAGDWERFTDFTSWRGSDYAGKIGAAFHWETYGDTTPNNTGSAFGLAQGTEGDLIVYTVDAALEGNGWNLFGAFIGSWTEADNGATDSTNDFAAVVQGGVFLTEQLELFGRWDAIFLDDERAISEDTFNFLTVGANYYFFPESHAVKGTVDLLFAFDETAPDLTGVTGLNTNVTSFLGQAEEPEIALRGQLSVLF